MDTKKKIEKIPLNERLLYAQNSKPNFLNVFEMFAEDYFYTLTKMTGLAVFQRDYDRRLIRYNNEDRINFFCELVYKINQLPDDIRLPLIFDIMIDPFFMLHQKDREMEEKNL